MCCLCVFICLSSVCACYHLMQLGMLFLKHDKLHARTRISPQRDSDGCNVNIHDKETALTDFV